MMEEQDIIKVLKKFENELKANDFNSLYKKIKDVDRCHFTQFFIDHDIDPLKYVTGKTPYYFAYKCNFKNTRLRIPESITEIGRYSFARTNITYLYIPSSVEKFHSGAFALCDDLKEVVMDGCPKLDDYGRLGTENTIIRMNCSEQEFKKKNYPYRSRFDYSNIKFLK